jgi:hypothetical protein
METHLELPRNIGVAPSDCVACLAAPAVVNTVTAAGALPFGYRGAGSMAM